jgi:tetratricopeptide (TPR) repeat protein
MRKTKFENKNRLLALILKTITVVVLMLAGCGKKATEPEKTVDELLSSGWSAFSQGSFSSALNYFNQVLSQNAGHPDALNGKGWCQGILGDRPGARSSFNAGLATAPTNNSLRAGLAFTHAAMDSSLQAVAQDSTVLAADSLWSLGHRYVMSWDYLMDWRDLRVLLAEEYFAMGRFSESLAQVKKLDPSVSVGTDFSLAENQAALLVEIERLSVIYK